MCGVVGMIGPRTDIGIVRQMMAAVQHQAFRTTKAYGIQRVSLGHKRLSVIDLESGNEQVHHRKMKTLWIVYNGEIYNFRHLRSELESKGHCFYTRTDTEVILHLYEEYGTNSFARLDGMFSFIIWDERKQRALLVRDRFGVKPLHYHWDDTTLCLGSEIKVLLSDPWIQREINPQAFHDFLNLRYVPVKRHLFQKYSSAGAGAFPDFAKESSVSLQRYWSMPIDENDSCTITAWSEKLRERIFSSSQSPNGKRCAFGRLSFRRARFKLACRSNWSQWRIENVFSRI